MPIYEVVHDQLRELQEARFADHGVRERNDLQRLLRDQIEVIDPELLIVAEEFADWDESRRRIDLLGLDRKGNLVIIELKRGESGGHMELQAVRYAAMVSTMTFDRVVEVYESYLAARDREVNAREQILEFLGWAEPDEEHFAQDVRIVLVSAEFSKEITTAVLWLNERDLDIRCVRLRPRSAGERLFLEVQQVIPLPEAGDYLVGVRQKTAEVRAARRSAGAWTGHWFVNLGMKHPDAPAINDNGVPYQRHWDLCRTHGYVCGGGGERYSKPLTKLEVGASVFVYQSKAGYLGHGTVIGPAAPAHLLHTGNGRPLTEVIGVPDLNSRRDQEKWEFALPVKWKETRSLAEAVTFPNVFANQNVVCKLRDQMTLQKLMVAFGLDESA